MWKAHSTLGPNRENIVTKLLLVAVAAATLILASACAPPPTGGGGGATGPVPICASSTSNYVDLLYNGTPDVAGNIVSTLSGIGTCSDPQFRLTAVAAQTAGEAQSACNLLFHDLIWWEDIPIEDLAVLGFPDLPDLWLCHYRLPLTIAPQWW